MKKFLRTLIAPVPLLAGLLLATNVLAESDEDITFDLRTITCWDLTGIDEQDRGSALLLVFGYVSGTKDLATFSGAEVGAALERAGKLCTANPDMYVTSAVERAIST
jgi:hypothetical protein